MRTAQQLKIQSGHLGPFRWDPALHDLFLLLRWSLRRDFAELYSNLIMRNGKEGEPGDLIPKVCFCFSLMVQSWVSHLCLCGSISSSLNDSFSLVIFLRSIK